MKDIAKEAGISISCVARYINKSGYVSQEKSVKIGEVMERLHYIPNQQARYLREGKTRLIGHVHASSAENIFFSKVAEEIEKASIVAGYQTISISLESENKEVIEQQLMTLLACRVDGLILNPGANGEVARIINEWAKRFEMPIIIIERPTDVYEISKVLVDNIEGSYLATDILISKGHKKIAYFGVDPIKAVEKERYYGYLHAMTMLNNDYANKHSYFTDDYTVENGYNKCLEILELLEGDLPTAICVTSDILVAGVLRALQEKQICVPEEISLIGFDDTIARFFSPPVSTMKLPIREIALAAIELLMEIIETDEAASTRTIKIAPSYKERESVRELK